MTDSKIEREFRYAQNAVKRAYQEQWGKEKTRAAEKKLKKAMEKKELARGLNRGRI